METQSIDEIEVYPNPIANQFSLSHISEPVHLEIINQTGQIIFKINAYSGEQINLESVVPGIYYVRISNKNFAKLMKVVKL